MDGPPTTELSRVFRERPVSVLILGASRPLVSWLALGLAAHMDPTYIWTDVRSHEEEPNPLGPLALGAIPEAQLSLIYPEQLERNEEDARLARAAAATVVRSDGMHDSTSALEHFLRLPSHTRELIAAIQPSPHIRFLVLANAERVVHQYPEETVAPILGAILASGCSVVLSFVGPPPKGRTAFDFVLEVHGGEGARWERSIVHCEKGAEEGLLRTGASFPLASFPGLAQRIESTPGAPVSRQDPEGRG